MKNTGYAGLSILLSLAFATPGMSQQAQPSAAETACNGKYTAYYTTQADAAKFTAFVDDPTCKDSMYREGAFQLMAKSNVDGMKWKAAVDLSDKMAKDLPNASASAKTYVYSQGLIAAGQL